MFKGIKLSCLALILGACVGRDLEITAKFDPREAAFVKQGGSAHLSGQAFMRQNGGGVVTCAGEEVNLFPATRYATERFAKIYGDVSGGRINVFQGVTQKGVPPEYLQYRRIAMCDAEGDFEFNGVAAGTYYVQSRVLWTVPNSYFPEGGSVAKRVTVRPGQKLRVLLN
ncbi:hypothetical protein [Neptunicoccus sediminis]|uniref:hypothetical protein n=1 Tax=Neptunicoccus sediminis TaxID=1892596 RepID=UPI000846014C|nr:hypothetical protein [Neptunicoccus sediminis]